MYISPVVYPLSAIPEKWHNVASYNPMVGIIETARYSIFGVGLFNYQYIINGLITTLILLLIGLLTFNKVEKTFLDTITIYSDQLDFVRSVHFLIYETLFSALKTMPRWKY